MKKTLLSIFIFSFLYSCSESITPPEEIAQKYYQNLISGNAKESYFFLSSEDKDNSTLADFKSLVVFDVGGEDSLSINDSLNRDKLGFGKLLMSLSKVDVVKITTANDTSIVELSHEVIDYELVFAQLFETLFSDFLNADGLNDSLKKNDVTQIFNELNKSELPRKKLENIKVNLKKEELGWVVFIDIENLINSRNLKIIEEEKEKNRLAEEKSEYMKNKISIFDFEATRIDTYLDKNIPAIRFAIKNIGNKSLDKVKVNVIFYDWDDLPIYENSYFPVLVSEYSMSGDTPLKPNYIKREKEGRYYTIEELGSEWSGKATISVSDIEFSSDN